MNRRQLCEALKVTPQTTFNYQKLGMPAEKANLSGTCWRWNFNLAKVKAWQRQYKTAQSKAKSERQKGRK